MVLSGRIKKIEEFFERLNNVRDKKTQPIDEFYEEAKQPRFKRTRFLEVNVNKKLHVAQNGFKIKTIKGRNLYINIQFLHKFLLVGGLCYLFYYDFHAKEYQASIDDTPALDFGLFRSASSMLPGCEVWNMQLNTNINNNTAIDSEECQAWCPKKARVGEWIQITNVNQQTWTRI